MGAFAPKTNKQLIYNTWKSTIHSSFFCRLQTVVYLQRTSPKVRLRSMDITFRNSKWLVHKNACEIFPYKQSQRTQPTSRIWQKTWDNSASLLLLTADSTATFTAHSLMTTVNDGPNASLSKQYGMQQTSTARRNIRYYHKNREHTVPQAICKGQWHDK